MFSRLVVVVVTVIFLASGCLTQSDDSNVKADEKQLPTAAAGPIVEWQNGTLQLSIATSARTFSGGQNPPITLVVAKNVTGFIVEMQWKASTQGAEKLSVWVEPRGQGSLAPDPSDPASYPQRLINRPPPTIQVDGTSPIKVPINVTKYSMKLKSEYSVLVRAAQPSGFAVNQAFDLAVSTFKGTPLNETFSAL